MARVKPGTEADERLLVEAAQRDPRRFSELYERNFARVYAYVLRRVSHRQEAEDLTAEVFQEALANLSRFEWRGAPFAAWLYKMAANAITDRWKRAAREQGNPSRDATEDSGETPKSSAEEDLQQTERRARLFKCVQRLTGDQRRVIEMRFAEEKSIREIAVALGRSEGAVKQLQFRALETLRQQMGKSSG